MYDDDDDDDDDDDEDEGNAHSGTSKRPAQKMLRSAKYLSRSEKEVKCQNVSKCQGRIHFNPVKMKGRLFSFSSEGLGSKVANSKAAEHDVCSRLCNQFQLLLENSELDS